DLGSDVALGPAGGGDAILSRDGTRLVYLSQSRLFTRRLEQAKAAEMTGTEGAHSPFFSPDRQWIAFFSAEKLKKISVQGGDALTLSTASSIKGGRWGEEGNIIASSGDVLLQIPSSGGAPTPVTELAPGEVSHCWPQVLPGGGAVLFTVLTSMAGVDGASIEAFSLKDRRRKTILR